MLRLKQRAEFLAVAAGTKVTAGAFILQGLRRTDDGPARVGFTVSKKVGPAVERYPGRRRLREAGRRSASPPLRARPDYVIVGRRAALTAEFPRLTTELEQSLARFHKRAQAPAPATREHVQ